MSCIDISFESWMKINEYDSDGVMFDDLDNHLESNIYHYFQAKRQIWKLSLIKRWIENNAG